MCTSRNELKKKMEPCYYEAMLSACNHCQTNSFVILTKLLLYDTRLLLSSISKTCFVRFYPRCLLRCVYLPIIFGQGEFQLCCLCCWSLRDVIIFLFILTYNNASHITEYDGENCSAALCQCTLQLVKHIHEHWPSPCTELMLPGAW